MALQIRKGLDSQRQPIAFKSGELVFTTDNKDLFVGDGTTAGGIRIAPIKSINGLAGSSATGALTLNTDNITEGATNKYYNSTTARIDAGAALVGGNNGSTGISFTYRSDTNTITASVTAGGYALPAATPTELGGVKISQGGLSIDGAGLLSVTTPVSAGTTGQLTYYTGTNAVGTAGTGMSWSPSNNLYAGGQLTVVGTVDAKRININASENNGISILTESDGNSFSEVFTINSAHTSATPTATRYFRSRGTILAPTSIQTGDHVFDHQYAGITGTSSAGIAAQIRVSVNGTVSAGVVPGKLVFSASSSNGTLIDSLTVAATKVSASVPFQVVSYADATARDAAITSPAAGMIVFLTGVSKFSGYSGAAWDNLN
jgi:hypothetical protein